MKKTEIAKILEWHNSGALKTNEAVERICSLFSVVGRSEQLCDYCKKPLENTCCNDCLEEMDNHNH
jgi:predicted amidophosphoribosyltransferase